MYVRLEAVQFENPDHMRIWYEIRSDESVRKYSRSVKKIKPEEHKAWWAESKTLALRKLFFIRTQVLDAQGYVNVGIARLDHRDTWTEFSIAIMTQYRGRNIGTNATSQLIEMTRRISWPIPGAVIGTKNAVSMKLFINAGFLIKKQGFIQFQYQPKR